MTGADRPGPAGAGDPAGADGEVYGLLVLAGVHAALPLSALREVVPCPDDLAALPVTATGLLGAMELRRLVVPVVDLRPLLGIPAERSADQVVVVIAHDDHLLGVLADEVVGITRVSESDRRRVRAAPRSPSAPAGSAAPTAPAGTGLVFSHTFRHPEHGRVVSVLDAAAVLSLPGVPTVHDPAGAAGGGPDALAGTVAASTVAAGAAAAGTATAGTATAGTATAGTGPAGTPGPRTGPRRKLTLLRCGGFVLGLDVQHVHTTLPGAAPLPSVLTSTLCSGVTPYVDRDVAVVDPLVLLGLGSLPPEEAGAGLVLDLGQGYVVLALTALLDLTEVAEQDVLALPAFAVHRPELLAGMVDVAGVGQCLVLDGDALRADRDLAALASVNTMTSGEELPAPPAAGTPEEADAVLVPGRAYLTYSAGVELATRLEQVAEILPLPATSTSTQVDPAVLGVFVHRSAAVPVLCLPTLLGLQPGPATAAACVLLVDADGDTVAFAVDALRAIDRLTWEDPDTAGSPPPVDDVAGALRGSPLVRVGEGNRLLPDLDLEGLARLVRGTPGPHREPGPDLEAGTSNDDLLVPEQVGGSVDELSTSG